jgi:hypothetical protein
MSSKKKSSDADLFYTIFNILDKNGLIKNHDEMDEEKRKALTDFIHYLDQSRSQDTRIVKNFKAILSTLNIDAQVKINIELVFDEIVYEIKKLQEENTNLQGVILAQDQRINELEQINDLQKSNMIAFDAIQMFIFYYVEPSIRVFDPKWLWRDFTSKLKNSSKKMIVNYVGFRSMGRFGAASD